MWYESLVWLTGAVVCLHAALRVQPFASAGNELPHNGKKETFWNCCERTFTDLTSVKALNNKKT